MMAFVPLFISFPSASLMYSVWWSLVEENYKRFASVSADCFSRTEIPMYTFEQAASLSTHISNTAGLQLTPRIAGIFAMYTVVMTLLYLIIIACSVAIHRAISQVSYTSSKVSAAQSQLSRVLYLQVRQGELLLI